MIYALLKLFHLLAIGLWVAGMGYTLFFLRPAVAALEPPVRTRLMHAVLQRFFRAALVAALLTLVTGYWMLGRTAKQVVQAGGQFDMPLAWTLMAVLGTLMVAIFFHIRFALFKRLDRAVAASDWAAGGAALLQIRRWVGVNLGLGLSVVVIAALRPFL